MAKINLGKVVPEKGVDYFTEEDKQELLSPINTRLGNLETGLATASNQINDINQNLQTVNTTITNLTNNKADKKDVEEQDTRITDLEKEVEILSETIDSELEDGTATGESITVNDSARAKAKLDVGGNTKQVQTNGYQMIHQSSELYTTSRNGLTMESYPDGRYKIYGTATANTQYCMDLKDGKLYNNVSTAHYSHLDTGDYIFHTTMIKGERVSLRARDSSTNLTPFGGNGSFTLENAIDGFHLYFYDQSGAELNLEFKIMLEKGSTMHEWEKYTGGQSSPSPEYPQEVQTVKGNNTIKVFNKNWITGNKTNTNRGITTTLDNNILTVQGTTSGNWWSGIENNAIIPAGDLCLSIQKALPFTLNFILTLEDGTTQNMSIHKGSTEATATIASNVVKYNINFAGAEASTTYNEVIQLQLKKGTIATDYEEHKEQILELTLPQGMEMCKIGDYRDGFVKDLDTGKWYKNKKIGKSIFDGSSDESWYYDSTSGMPFRLTKSDFPIFVENQSIAPKIFSNQYVSVPWNQINSAYSDSKYLVSTPNNASNLRFRNRDCNTFAEFKETLASKPMTLYYPLAEPILEEITDETLISQLDKLYEVITYYGQTNVTYEGDGLSPIFTLNYKKSNRILRSEIDSIKARLDLLEN